MPQIITFRRLFKSFYLLGAVTDVVSTITLIIVVVVVVGGGGGGGGGGGVLWCGW